MQDILKQLVEISNIDPGLVPRILELLDVERASSSEKEFYKALSQLQGELPDIPKNEAIIKVVEGKKIVKYRYASMDVIRKSIQKLLTKYGFCYHFTFTQDGDNLACCCYLSHIGGHFITSEMQSKIDTSADMNDLQKVGSTMQYLMRYTLTAVLGLTTSEDNDANFIDGNPQQKPFSVIPEPKKKDKPTKIKLEKEKNKEELFGGGND